METTQKLAKLIILCSALLVGCSTSKKVSQQEAFSIETSPLTDEQKGRFEPVFLAALKQQSMGNYEVAQDLYIKAMSIDSTCAPCAFQLGKIYIEMNQPELALGNFKTATTFNTNNKWYTIELAKAYSLTGYYTLAADLYDNLFEQYPTQYQYLFDCANNLLNARDYEKAAEKYQQIQSLTSYRFDITEQVFKIYLSLGEPDKAVEEVHKFLEVFPNNIKAYSLLTQYYSDEGDLDQVIYYYEKMVEIKPEDPLILLSLSTVVYQNGDPERSFQLIKQTFENPALEPSTRISVITKIEEKTNYAPGIQAEILKMIEQSLEFYPNSAELWALLGDYYAQESNIESARNAYTKSLELSKDNYGVYIQLILIYNEIENYDSVESVSQMAVEHFPNQPAPYLFYGYSQGMKENYPAAIKALKQGARITFNNDQLLAEFYAALGNSYYENAEYQNAWIHYEKALKLNPNNDLVLNNYAYQLSEHGTNLDLALSMIEKALKAQPNSAIYLDTYGWILYQLQSYDLAKNALEKAIKNGGNEMSDVCLHLSKVYEALGDELKAKEWRQKSAELE